MMVAHALMSGKQWGENDKMDPTQGRGWAAVDGGELDGIIYFCRGDESEFKAKLWRASEWSIRESVRNAMALAAEKGFQSIGFPLIGAGSGGFNQEQAKAIMEESTGSCRNSWAIRT
ncbi:MAG: macro domain-containing protein [Thermoguttaceae bacterium]